MCHNNKNIDVTVTTDSAQQGFVVTYFYILYEPPILT